MTLAQHWADRLNLPLLSELPSDISVWDFVLHVAQQRLSLASAKQLNTSVYTEFIHENMGYRLKNGGGRKQTLARACGLKPNHNPSILDLSAGLGKDSFILASLGCDVTLIERHPIVSALLENGLYRASQHALTTDICQRLHLHHIDSLLIYTTRPALMLFILTRCILNAVKVL